MVAIVNIDTMNKTVKIYALPGEIRSGVSARTNEPWAIREAVLQILDPSRNMEPTGEKVVVNLWAANEQLLQEVKMEDKYVVRLKFGANLYDKTGRWYNNIKVDLSEAQPVY